MLPWLRCRASLWAWRSASFRCQRATFSCWQVSSLGRVKNTRGQISHGCLYSSGYRGVRIKSLGHDKGLFVHRLVAYAFLGPPSSPLLIVNHIDGNRENNCVHNLEYVSQSENMLHSWRNRREQGVQVRRGKTVEVRPLGTTAGWRTYPSVRQAAEAVGVHVESARQCCQGRKLSCRGHEFRFVENSDLPSEVWKDAVCPKTKCILPGYRISSCGRIEGPTGMRTYGRCKSGYRAMLCRGTELLVHRIMASTFLKVPASNVAYWEINHKDGNKANNHIENLEVTTRSENILHAWRMRATREVPSQRRPVEGRHLLTDTLSRFASVTEAARHVGKSKTCITDCCRGRSKSCGGHRWRYSSISETDCLDEDWRDVDLLGLIAAWEAGLARMVRD